VVLTACYFGYRARGGAAGVGRAVTRSVVCNIVLLFALDLVLTVLMAN
jgi:phospholipid/cholesterol/gamma-HCH transport system permease protein